jgi:hypothetical protein
VIAAVCQIPGAQRNTAGSTPEPVTSARARPQRRLKVGVELRQELIACGHASLLRCGRFAAYASIALRSSRSGDSRVIAITRSGSCLELIPYPLPLGAITARRMRSSSWKVMRTPPARRALDGSPSEHGPSYGTRLHDVGFHLPIIVTAS